jgi:hypothetical protein
VLSKYKYRDENEREKYVLGYLVFPRTFSSWTGGQLRTMIRVFSERLWHSIFSLNYE